MYYFRSDIVLQLDCWTTCSEQVDKSKYLKKEKPYVALKINKKKSPVEIFNSNLLWCYLTFDDFEK